MKGLKKIFFLGLSLLVFIGCRGKAPEANKGQGEMENPTPSIGGPSQVNIEKSSGLDKFTMTIFDSFDTVTQTTVFAETEEEGLKYSQYIEDRLAQLHKEFSSFESYQGINNAYTINQKAGQEPVVVSKELFDLIKNSKAYYETYSKKNDISFGRVTEIWRSYMDLYAADLEDTKGKSLPSIEDLEAANGFTNMDNIVLDEEKLTVFIKDPQTRLDLGAVAKGYAVELIGQELREMGAQSVLISAGGNVKALGGPQDGARDFWAIGIKNPENTDTRSAESIKEILYIEDLSVVTSGDYERFFTVDGKNYHHIIDTETLFPADYFRSITIVGQDSALADFLSTAIFSMDLDSGLALIESIEGVEAYWILKDGSTVYSPGMEKYMQTMGASPSK
ncbi:MAG: FAD:protein FMN transferase [Bacillota bacterium]|nr:FAD:protein FMN transferase [Bacillota bacterium]